MKSKKIIATAIAGAMMVSCAACSKTSKEEKAVASAAEEYITAVLGQETEDIADLSDGIDEETVEGLITFDSYKEDVCDAILSSTSCTINKKSIEVDGKTATIDVTFVMPDYETVAEDDDYEDDDDIISQLEDAEELEIEVTIELKNKKDTWLVTNTEEVIEEVYAFSIDYPFAASVVGSYKSEYFSGDKKMADYYLVLEADNTCAMTIDMQDYIKQLYEDWGMDYEDADLEDYLTTYYGTYSVEGDVLTMTIENDGGAREDFEGTIGEDGSLDIFDSHGEEMVFERE